MTARRVRLGSALSGAVALAIALPALAQMNSASGTLRAPDYGSGVSAGAMSNEKFNTPESEGRPGVKFFKLAVQAFRDGDYRHAIDMYKVAASWAYKPAEYNLGVMYFKGQGVPADHALGAAWMVLAAERGTPLYVKARDLMVTTLTKTEFARTDELWGRLKRTYGDEVALRRAKAQWTWVGNHRTGTRVGGAAGESSVGVMDTGHTPVSTDMSGRSIKSTTTAAGMMQGGSADGSMAYRQFDQSDNPYDPIFLKNRSGTATVGPLQPVKPDKAEGKSTLPQDPDASQNR